MRITILSFMTLLLIVSVSESRVSEVGLDYSQFQVSYQEEELSALMVIPNTGSGKLYLTWLLNEYVSFSPNVSVIGEIPDSTFALSLGCKLKLYQKKVSESGVYYPITLGLVGIRENTFVSRNDSLTLGYSAGIGVGFQHTFSVFAFNVEGLLTLNTGGGIPTTWYQGRVVTGIGYRFSF